MLSLTRNVGETIIINTPQGDIEITISEINRQQARIGLTAPQSFNIRRKELPPKTNKQLP